VTRIGLLASDSLTERLTDEATSAGVDVVPDLNDAIFPNPENYPASVAVEGVVIEWDHLSLRLVARLDELAIPFAVIAPSAAEERAQAFGVQETLPVTSSWPELLRALNVQSEGDPLAPEPDSEADAEDGSNPSVERRARVVSVWGPVGAPGRSVAALNIASERALAGDRVLLIDADTYGGSLAAYVELFDEAPGFLAACRLATMDALSESELQRLCHDVDLPGARMKVLSGIVNARRWPELTAARVREGLERLRSFFDVIVADVGFNLEQDEEIASDLTAPRRNQATIEVIRSSDEVVAVLAADVIGVARFIQARELLMEIFEGVPLVVANRVRSHRSSSAPIVRHTLGRFAGIQDVHIVDEDATAFGASLDAAAPLCIAAPKSQVRKQFREISERLCATKVATH
jgi:MinD-like ATPase involved in chromosome partitioning or flagellar assembly